MILIQESRVDGDVVAKDGRDGSRHAEEARLVYGHCCARDVNKLLGGERASGFGGLDDIVRAVYVDELAEVAQVGVSLPEADG